MSASQKMLDLEQSHEIRAAGNVGFVKSLHLVKRQFWWPKMKKDIEAYMASYPMCTSMKQLPGKPP